MKNLLLFLCIVLCGCQKPEPVVDAPAPQQPASSQPSNTPAQPQVRNSPPAQSLRGTNIGRSPEPSQSTPEEPKTDYVRTIAFSDSPTQTWVPASEELSELQELRRRVGDNGVPMITDTDPDSPQNKELKIKHVRLGVRGRVISTQKGYSLVDIGVNEVEELWFFNETIKWDRG